jgi:small neutral amino acid transporter SnatA (MarC family)
MGKIAFHTAIETLTPTGFEYAAGWMKRYPNVSITIVEGRLVATMTYVEAFIAPAVMRQLGELVVSILEDCATASAGA